MTVPASSMALRKAVINTDTVANGGRCGRMSLVDRARYNLFPRVTAAERAAGLTRYRKLFVCDEDPSDEAAYAVLVWLGIPTLAADRMCLGEGAATDSQSGMLASPPDWLGVGRLTAALAGGETAIEALMEAADYAWPNGGKIALSNTYKAGQSVASGVRAMESVQYAGGVWTRIATTTDYAYPKGVYLGGGVVLTNDGATTEILSLADKLTENEVVGTGDATTTPTLASLANIVNGVCGLVDKRPALSAICGGVARAIAVAADGACTGYCSAGKLNMATGAWLTPVVWTTAPDSGTDITATYRDLCYAYTGNVATLELSEQVANAYAAANTYVAGCVGPADLEASVSDWSETSSAGTYDETSSPPTLYLDGVEEDTFTLTMTSATGFTCSGTHAGSLGTGVVGSDFSPVNASTGQPYFTLLAAGWAGVWAVGDAITFKTHKGALAVWLKEVVPAGAAAEADNNTLLMRFWE